MVRTTARTATALGLVALCAVAGVRLAARGDAAAPVPPSGSTVAVPAAESGAPDADVPPHPRVGAVPPTGPTYLHIGSWTREIRRGDQATIDACRYAVLWAGPMPGPLATSVAGLAGHDYCGFRRFGTLALGTLVTVSGPYGATRYRVVGHAYWPDQSTGTTALYRGDLTLQSCQGSGTAFSYLVRV